jgi:transcriptional regulator with XRE-family HTH domain
MSKSGRIDTEVDRLIRDNLKAIGARAKEIRRKLGLKQKTISERLNVVNSYLSDIENGKGNPGHTFFFKFSFLFNVSLDFLFYGKGEMFLKLEKTPPGDQAFVEEIKTIDDLVWYMKNSPIFFHQIMAFAGKFAYENEEVLKRNIKKNRAGKKA